MSEPVATSGRGATTLLSLACLVILIAGLKAASALMLPILVALFLSLLCIPPMNRLQEMGLPDWLAVALVITGATLVVILLTIVLANSASDFQARIPHYRNKLDGIVDNGLRWLNARGLKIERSELFGDRGDAGSIMNQAAEGMKALLGVLSNVLLVVLTMIFILFEAKTFKRKMQDAFGRDSDLSAFDVLTQRIRKYLAIKTWVSLGTGVCAGLVCWAAGVDFPFVWALVAFLFNFVPNIGSVLAAIFPVLLALTDRGWGTALLVASGYAAINLIIGNMIEPRWMGQRLGLSTLVVFLSLLFWGWVWGPVGTLLSVPLTVIVKIALEHTNDFRWIAVVLGPPIEPADEVALPDETDPPDRQPAAPVLPDQS